MPPYTFKYSESNPDVYKPVVEADSVLVTVEYAIPGSTLFSRSGLIAWTTSQAIVTISVHASQIQFLTLLFPSTLENKLILLSLGMFSSRSRFLTAL